MAKVKVYAPNRTYNGAVGAYRFSDGVAEVEEDDAAIMGYLEQAGYGIGHRPGEPEDPEANVDWPDPRSHSEPFGTPLRDAAVDPKESDYLAPIGAGTAHPHSSKVVAPGIHGVGPAPIRPGEVYVDDPAKQEAEEKALAKAVLIDHEPATIVASNEPAGGPLGLSDPGSVEMGTRPENLARGTTMPEANQPEAASATQGAMEAPSKGGSQAAWVDYAVSKGAERASVEDLSRADLIKQYG